MNQSEGESDSHRFIAGVDIGGTTTQVLLCTPELVVLDRLEVPTPAADGGDAMAASVVSSVRTLTARAGGQLIGVGVGAAGVVNPRSRTIEVASQSFVGWSGYQLGQTLESALHVPVTVENDVNAFLLGEARLGAVAGADNVLAITLGTGVGGALVLDGRLWSGSHNAAGELGHIPGFGNDPCTCGGRGHLETVASGNGISRFYETLSGLPASARTVSARALEGDGDALTTLQRAGHGVARGILMVAGLLDISSAVIGGGVSHSWPVLGPMIDAALHSEPPVSGASIVVHRSQLGSDAVALGAASRVALGPGAA